MAKQSKFSLADKVNEMRSRLRNSNIDMDVHEASSRLYDIEHALHFLRGVENQELFRHFPVAAIATLEAYFRSSVASIIDQGGEYLSRGVALLGDRVKASEIIPMIHKKSVTIGQIVAYSLPFSSMAHLEEVFDALLGESFKQLSRHIANPYSTRNEFAEKEPIVNDVPALWASLHKTFHDRHILAHELATQFFIDYDNAQNAITSVKLITEVIDATLWSTIWKDEPLTQYEMNCAARDKYLSLRLKLAKIIREKRSDGYIGSHPHQFRKLHFRWKAWVMDWCEYSSNRFKGGSIRPFIHATELTKEFQDYIKTLDNVAPY